MEIARRKSHEVRSPRPGSLDEEPPVDGPPLWQRTGDHHDSGRVDLPIRHDLHGADRLTSVRCRDHVYADVERVGPGDHALEPSEGAGPPIAGPYARVPP